MMMVTFSVFFNDNSFPCKCVLIFLSSNHVFKMFIFAQSVEGECHERAVELLKAAIGSVKLVVRYTPKVLEEMEQRFERMRLSRRQNQRNNSQTSS